MDPWLTLLLGIALGAMLGALCTVIVLQRRAARAGAATSGAGPYAVDPAVLEARHQVDLAEPAVRRGQSLGHSARRARLGAGHNGCPPRATRRRAAPGTRVRRTPP
ncbi:hypothetical protein [Cryobacterium breve]|uniref:hypothetical protein n=1 Tax=Cryobacterium breve TaxID=1259258 RepID=UPI00248C5F54|nr:hypothetical protein [Cryobacterium breve]